MSLTEPGNPHVQFRADPHCVRKSNDLQEQRRGSLLYEGSSANQILRLPTWTAALEWSVHHAFSDVRGRERIALSVLWQPGQFSNTIVDSDDSSLRESALGIAMDPRKLARALMALRAPAIIRFVYDGGTE